jgi:UDP-glucuronate 4-epimerase
LADEERRSPRPCLGLNPPQGKSAIKEMLPMQPGDVEATYADVTDLERDIGFRPSTSIEDGIAGFAKWYREFHKA